MDMEDVPPEILKPGPVIFAWEIKTVATPVLVTVKVCKAVEPRGTVPKLTATALAESVPECEPGFGLAVGVSLPVKATQPERDIAAAKRTHNAGNAHGAVRFSSCR